MNQNLEYNLSLNDLFNKTMGKAISNTGKLDNKFDRLGNKANGLTNKVGKVGLAIAGAFAIGGVLAFGNAIKDSLVNYEYFTAAIKTMLRGDEYAAKALQSQLINLAKTTPFSLNDTQDASKQLLAYGFQAGNLVDVMKTLGNVSAGVGAPLKDIAYLYGTLKTSGRVSLLDLRQFAGRGIPIYETLAKRLKTTSKHINELVHDGKIGFKDIEGAFKDMTKEGGQFFGLMDAQSRTVGGRLSNMGDAWEQLKVNIGKSQSGILSSTISWAGSMLDKLNQKLSAGNFLDEALAKAGQLDKYNGLDRFYGNLAGVKNVKGLAGNYAEMQDEAAYGQQLVSSAQNLKQALYNLQIVQMNLQKNMQARKDGTLSNSDFITKSAIQQETVNQLKGVIKLFQTKTGVVEGGNTDGNSTAKSESLGTGIEASVSRPQDLHINIERLVEHFTIHTENITESAIQTKDRITQALLEAINDINYITKQK